MLGALFVVVLYPVMGVLMGWISGFLSAVIYNFVVRWTGGLLMEFDTPATESSPQPVG
jgi:prepilin signal peptidase PulO-like enzyme (type II secretory pathway)